MRGSSAWARSHQTVAFCRRIIAVYDEPVFEERFEFERRIEVLCFGRELEEAVEVVAFDNVLRFDIVIGCAVPDCCVVGMLKDDPFEGRRGAGACVASGFRCGSCIRKESTAGADMVCDRRCVPVAMFDKLHDDRCC